MTEIGEVRGEEQFVIPCLVLIAAEAFLAL
jgi:hypothetical protein